MQGAAQSVAQTNDSQSDKTEKESKEKKVDEKDSKSVEKEKDVKDVKSEPSPDEMDSMPDDEQATNEQTHPSSKHIENETEEKGHFAERKEPNKKKGRPKSHLGTTNGDSESGVSGSGLFSASNDENAGVVTLSSRDAPSRDFLIEDKPGKLTDLVASYDSINRFNQNVHSSSETVNEVEDEEDNGSSEAVEEASGASGDDLSGVKKSNKDEENGSETKNAEDDKEENKKYGDQAAEKERTENAEKYEDEEKEDKKDAKKPVKQKKKNLMETMLDNGELQAVSVAKGKARQKVPVHANKENEDDGEDEQEEEEEEDATNIDLNFKDTGLEQFSGSGSDDGMVFFIIVLPLNLSTVEEAALLFYGILKVFIDSHVG